MKPLEPWQDDPWHVEAGCFWNGLALRLKESLCWSRAWTLLPIPGFSQCGFTQWSRPFSAPRGNTPKHVRPCLTEKFCYYLVSFFFSTDMVNFTRHFLPELKLLRCCYAMLMSSNFSKNKFFKKTAKKRDKSLLKWNYWDIKLPTYISTKYITCK